MTSTATSFGAQPSLAAPAIGSAMADKLAMPLFPAGIVMDYARVRGDEKTISEFGSMILNTHFAAISKRNANTTPFPAPENATHLTGSLQHLLSVDKVAPTQREREAGTALPFVWSPEMQEFLVKAASGSSLSSSPAASQPPVEPAASCVDVPDIVSPIYIPPHLSASVLAVSPIDNLNAEPASPSTSASVTLYTGARGDGYGDDDEDAKAWSTAFKIDDSDSDVLPLAYQTPPCVATPAPPALPVDAVVDEDSSAGDVAQPSAVPATDAESSQDEAENRLSPAPRSRTTSTSMRSKSSTTTPTVSPESDEEDEADDDEIVEEELMEDGELDLPEALMAAADEISSAISEDYDPDADKLANVAGGIFVADGSEDDDESDEDDDESDSDNDDDSAGEEDDQTSESKKRLDQVRESKKRHVQGYYDDSDQSSASEIECLPPTSALLNRPPPRRRAAIAARESMYVPPPTSTASKSPYAASSSSSKRATIGDEEDDEDDDDDYSVVYGEERADDSSDDSSFKMAEGDADSAAGAGGHSEDPGSETNRDDDEEKADDEDSDDCVVVVSAPTAQTPDVPPKSGSKRLATAQEPARKRISTTPAEAETKPAVVIQIDADEEPDVAVVPPTILPKIVHVQKRPPPLLDPHSVDEDDEPLVVARKHGGARKRLVNSGDVKILSSDDDICKAMFAMLHSTYSLIGGPQRRLMARNDFTETILYGAPETSESRDYARAYVAHVASTKSTHRLDAQRQLVMLKSRLDMTLAHVKNILFCLEAILNYASPCFIETVPRTGTPPMALCELSANALSAGAWAVVTIRAGTGTPRRFFSCDNLAQLLGELQTAVRPESLAGLLPTSTTSKFKDYELSDWNQLCAERGYQRVKALLRIENGALLKDISALIGPAPLAASAVVAPASAKRGKK